MNKLSAIIGNNTQNVFDEVIKTLKGRYSDLSKENIIIVPDRLSLLAEQKIFELLGIEVYFNISVMGISKFATKIINENNLNYIECSAIQAKLLCLRAIQNVRHNFKCFSTNYTLGFVDEIYAKIEQIKSSNVDINDLYDVNASEGTKLKFEDLKLIYNEYEILRAQRLDSGALLSLFNNICTDSESLRNANVYFVGFDSMTKQGIEVLNNVTKTALNTCIGVVAPHKQNNENIYDKTFLTAVTKLCDEQGFQKDFKQIDTELKNEDSQNIINNLFCRKNKFKSNGYINIYKSATTSDEIDFIIKSINYNLKTKNLRFKDIAVCAPKNYHEILKTKLWELDIDSYSDMSYPLVKIESIKYLLSIIKFIKSQNDKNSFMCILTNELCDLSKNKKEILLNYLSQYSNINTIKKLNNIDSEILDTIDKYINIKVTGLKVKDYLKKIKKILADEKVLEKNKNLCDIFEQSGEITLQKLYLQTEDKLVKILDQIDDIMGQEEMPFEDFCNIFEKAILDTELMGVPSTIDQIFVGDTKSYYGNAKYLYVISANDDIFPELLNDMGLISDKEISSESIRASLEPTTKIINKRNKFKALEVLVSASEKCYISYHAITSDNRTAQASEFITELKELFQIKEIDTAIFNVYPEEIDSNKICFNNQDDYNANLNLRSSQNVVVDSIISTALLKNNMLFFKPVLNKVDVDYGSLYFTDNKASVSIIEKYNSCPRASFLANGLKLQKRKKDKVEANIIGSFIHEVAEQFVKKNKTNLGKLNKRQVESSTNIIIDEIISNDKYYSINLEENAFIFKLIKNECNRFCQFINVEQTLSDFKPVFTEKYFGKNSNFKPIEIDVNGEKYIVTGIVDRIDVCDDYFRIIDYKSGNTTNARGKENLYYGTKIQLFVYSEAIRLNMGKKLFGTFFLPIKNNFVGNGESNYYLSGFFAANPELVMSSDKSLSIENRTSKLLGCSFNKPNKNGEMVLSKKENILTEEELKAFNKYSVELIKKTVMDMSSGYIDSSPISGKCNVCEFNGICQFANDKRIERSENYDVKKDSFVELNYGE